MSTIENCNEYRRLPPRFWLQYLDVTVLKRSLVLALVIGGVLTLVNQSAALFGDVSFKLLPLVLVFITPFVVITISQLAATHCAVTDAVCGQASVADTPFITTLFAHDIPLRALVVGLFTGGVNSLLIFIDTLLQTGDITNAPLLLLAQVYVLPFVFGAFSQALAYRRRVAASAVYLVASKESK